MESEYQFEQKHDAPAPTLKADMKMINSIGRLALSKSICRFELPMDMRAFKTMTPAAYLSRYCKVNDRRKALYRRVFDKSKIKSEKESYVDLKTFEECLMDIHMKSITKDQIKDVLNLACLDPGIQITFPIFVGLAALSERVLYDRFVTEDTIDLPHYQKDRIECADFGSLKSKLYGVEISASMLKLLRSL